MIFRTIHPSHESKYVNEIHKMRLQPLLLLDGISQILHQISLWLQEPQPVFIQHAINLLHKITLYQLSKIYNKFKFIKAMLALSSPPQPLLLLIEELKEPMLKTRSIKSIATIALALGPVDTREFLVPFLSNLFHQESMDCQLAILEITPSLIPYLGHSFHSYLLLEMVIDILCLYDEKDIRELGFSCLFKILSRVDIRKAQSMLYNSLKQLQEQKDIKIKQLVIRMIPPIFIGLEPSFQTKFMQLYLSYSNDEKEDVRVIVSSQLQELIRIMPPAPQTQIKLLLVKFLDDPSQKVKANLLQCIILLNQLLGQETIKEYFNRLINDPNSNLKCQIYQRIQVLSREFSFELLEPFYKQIEGYAEFQQGLKNKVIGKLPVLFEIYPEKYREGCLKELLLPSAGLQLQSSLAESLCAMKDQEHLTLLLQKVDNSFKQKLLPKLPTLGKRSQMIRQLLKQKNFRSRCTILSHIESRLSSQPQDLKPLLDITLQATSDKASIVRSTACAISSKLLNTLSLDVQKSKQKLSPLLLSKTWSIRFSGLQIIKNILRKDNLKLWQIARVLKTDKVMSVRMKVVEIAERISELGVKSCCEEVSDIRAEVLTMY